MGMVSYDSSSRASYYYICVVRNTGEDMMKDPDFWKIVVILIGIGYLIGSYL